MSTGSMRRCLGEDVDHHDSRADQSHADQRRRIQGLFENKPPHQRNKDDAHARPNGVRNACWYCRKCLREEVKRHAIHAYRRNAWHQPGKPQRGFHEAGGNHFGDDGNSQEKVGFGHTEIVDCLCQSSGPRVKCPRAIRRPFTDGSTGTLKA